MKEELGNLKKILTRIENIAKESQNYWLGEAGEFHRTFLLEWCKDSMQLVREIEEVEDAG